jgi:hypothetical protein
MYVERCGKMKSAHTQHTNTHDDWFISGFHQKKNHGGKKKKERNVCVRRPCYLPLLFGRTSERANEAGEIAKRKSWPTSSSNREEKVCMYMAVRG